MKLFWKLLMMAVYISFGENEGGGSSEYEGEAASDIPATTSETQNNDSVTMSREELQQLLAPMQEYSQEKAVTAATSDIQSRIPEFDLGKVHDFLKEMHKTNPAQAEAMNNPQGWELLHLREFAGKTVNADAVNGGRNVASDGGRNEIVARLKAGEGSRFDAENLLEKYL